MSNKPYSTSCPICGTSTKAERRAWFYTCIGCGSGINMIGIWWKEKTGTNWLELSEKDKQTAGEQFFSKEKDSRDWSSVVIEL